MAARSVNKVIIMGNLVRDPELRYTGKGTPICTFSVATNREWKPTDSGEAREEVEFHNVVAWSKLAELCAELLYKGRRVYIEGRLQTRDWVDEPTGKKMYRTEIVAEEMIAIGAPKGGTEGGSPTENMSVPAQPAVSSEQSAPEEPSVQLREVTEGDQGADNGDDIPF